MTVKRKEPCATKEESDRKVLNMDRAPVVDLGSHGTSHLLVGEKTMLSFVDLEPNSYAVPHRHKGIEQVSIVLRGEMDLIVEGKLYSVHEGDVVFNWPDEEHGCYVGPNGARVLDVFCPPRPDLLEKLPRKTSPTD